MEYQELLELWNNSDKALQNNIQVNRRLIKDVGVSKIKSSLYEIRWTAYFELVVGFFWNIFLLGFIMDHFFEVKFALPALLLLLISAFTMFVDGYKLFLYYSLNSSASIFETQKKLESLRYYERLDTRSLAVIIPLFAAPFLIVFLKASLGLDLYIFQGPLLSLIIGSIGIGALISFILLRFPDKGLEESLDFLEDLKEEKEI